ncbi:MbcA/ParS/Xre antitoxin family protein [Paenibacillus sp. N3.4]|uniref:MbcA/ParS/Xre antitoxin family protein n=1 Tax=Paenibacillus sp. N3.4 TaxID=2603222 RepID=UPI0016507E63|nr:MbcA/ParS/Xre antitoxin family protein [Paenibacillus sp. N3.4]
MNGVEVLAREYKESTWLNYLNYCKIRILSLTNESRNCLDDLEIDTEIKIVLIVRFQSYAREWLHKKVPALDEQKPMELLATESGTKAVKEALLRIPD